MALKLSSQHIITALGLRFWMNAIEDLGISCDVIKCINLSQHLQSVISNNQQDFYIIEDDMENDDLFLVCIAYGVQFWHQVVMEHGIKEVIHCKTVLDYFQRVIIGYDFNKVESDKKLKRMTNGEHSSFENDFNNDIFDNSPPNSPAPSQNVLIKFKKTIREPKAKVLKCDYCEKSFSTFQKAEIHMQIRHPEFKHEFDKKNLVFKCEKGCDKAFNTNLKLMKHYKWTHISKITDCEYCPVKSATPLKAVWHNKTEHPEMKDEFDAKFRVHKCKEEGCVKNFFTSKGLREHRRRYHRRREYDDASSTLCPDCGISFATFQELKKHKKTHNRVARNKPPVPDNIPKPCTLCGETFLGKYKWTTHMFKVHNVGAYFCDDCGKKFQTRALFEGHKQRMHLKIKFDCNICGNSFKVERNLERHMKRVHSSNEERKHKCDQCGKGFESKETYVGHMNMHLGLKPYKCEYCGAAYQNRSNLMAHLKKSCKNNPNLLS